MILDRKTVTGTKDVITGTWGGAGNANATSD